MQVQYRNFASFFSLKFAEIAFVSSSDDSTTSSHVIAESSVKLTKYFPFLQLHVGEYHIQSFSDT